MNLPTTNTKKRRIRPRVFITGASGKIGIKVLEIFLSMGFRVVAQYSKNDKKIKDFLAEKPAYKRKNVELLKANFETEVPEIPRDISCLVNCASIFETGNLENCNSLLKQSLMNCFFPAELTSQFAKFAEKGVIINFLDGNIYRFNEFYQNYRISKLFFEEITKQSALLFAPKIRVNAIALGMLEDQKNRSNLRAKKKEILKNEITYKNIAKSIEFLVNCENLTGQIIYLDNGVHLI